MFLENLQLENFKNYSACSLTFNRKLNFIFGENGNGKTNILEAVSLLCYTKSFLLNSDADCTAHSANGFCIAGEFCNDSGLKNRVKMTYSSPDSSKALLYGNEKVTRMNEFIGQFPLIVLSPQDLKLTSGTPNDRRRNFDLLISQVSKVYLDDLRSFSRVIRQKNSLLRDNLFSGRYTRSELTGLIEPWNEELTDFGLKVLLRRLDFIEEFRVYLNSCFSQIVGERYVPVISYNSDLLPGNDELSRDVNTLREQFRAKLKDKLDMEIRRGISLIGPHRDNYVFAMEKDGKVFDIKTFASQGEHKTFVVSLKLSEFGYMKENLRYTNKGEPILLLDDVFSELDKNRINKISSMITSYNQVFLTTTDHDYLKILKNDFTDISAFQITNGTASLVN